MKETRKGMLILISGPSGTGKGTLCEKLREIDTSIQFSVSVTTRKPRLGEVEGEHYFFISEERYDELLKADAFLEHATVHGHRYGTLATQVDEGIQRGANMLLDIDPQGAIAVMNRRPDCVSIFILPPSYKDLRVRLKTRNTEDPEEIQRRLNNARGEIAHLPRYQYCIVNDDLELAFEQLCNIVSAEKQRTTRYFPVIEDE